MVSRRRFLGMAAASAAGMLIGAPLFAEQIKPVAGEFFLMGDGAKGDASLLGMKPYSSQPGGARIWRPGQKEIHEIKLPFFPHAFAPDPNAPHRVITFEKWGRHMAEIDLATMSVVRVTQAPAGRRFFGHGAHSGAHIYATQMNDAAGRSVVSVMDSADHKVVNEFETQGAFAHDCQWQHGTDTLLVVNSRRSGGQRARPDNFSSLVWMDAKTGKCLRQVYIKTRKFGYAHLAQSAEGYMVLSGSHDSREGKSQPILSVIHPDGSARELDIASSTKETLQGEVLSLYLDEHESKVTATFPNASRIQAWDYRTGKFLRQIEVDEPRGLAYSRSQGELLVSSARAKRLLKLDQNLVVTPVESDLGGNGSHLYRMEL